jgi:UDP:flavonoid glycosyltransferase YjiC (YdhE family)
VFVERYIPQSLLLPYCDLVVTHGGHNTVLASLHQGLPLVIVPITADQPDNAARCEALGLGLNIPNDGDVAAGVRAGAAEVLRDPKYRQNARKMREEMQSLQGLQTGVDLLEELAEPLSEKRERR